MAQKSTENLSSDFTFVKKIIKKLVTGTPVSYPLQVKICKQLLDQYNNKKFWLWFKPSKEINSLVWFLSEWGKEDLRVQYALFTQPKVKNETPIPLGEKCGEDKVIVKTKKTLSDWLK